MKKLLLFGLLLSASVSFAQNNEPHPIDVKLEKCMDADDNTMAMNACLEQAFKDWDKEMNRVYNALMKKLPADAQAALKSSQKAWLSHRDLEIKNIRSVYGHIYDVNGGGTMYSTISSSAVTDLIKTRTLQLSDLLDNLQTFAGEND